MRSLWIVLVLLLFLCSCEEKQTEKPTPTQVRGVTVDTVAMDSILTTYPQVDVSITQPLNFYFNTPIIEKDKIGTVHPLNPISFNPPIKGVAKWVNQKKLRFIPDEQLQINTQYTCTIDGMKLYNSPVISATNKEFTFKTAMQEISHFSGDFRPKKGEVNTVTFIGNITFAQEVNVETIKKEASIKLSGKPLSCTFTQSSPNSITIKSVEQSRTNSAKELTITLPKKYNPNGKIWQKMIILPELRTFRVMSHSESASGDEKSYSFLMSDEIREEFNLSGFVRVSPSVKYTVKAKGKKLTITGKFKFNNEYSVTILRGLPSAYGTKTGSDYRASFVPNNLKPKLEFLSEGLFLPTENDFKVQFRSVNVKKAHLVVYEIFPRNINFFLQENDLEPRDQKSVFYSLERVGKRVYSDTIEIDSRKNRWRNTELDLSKYMKGKKGAAFAIQVNFDRYCLTGKVVENRYDNNDNTLYYEDDGYYSSPANWGYYYENGKMQKLLFNSDIALTMKEHSDGTTVYATNILTAKPVSDLPLTVYSYLGEEIESATTDNSGTVTFNKKKDWSDHNANYIMAKHSSGYALIKCYHTSLPTNGFDVSGIVEDEKGTSVFTYADRGVHRPGDTVFLSSIIRLNKKVPSKGMNARYTVKNPNGQQIFAQSVKCGEYGHISVAIPTEMTAPTGNYSVQLDVGGSTFYKTLKIETVKPNRLKIEADVADTLTGSMISGSIETKYLFGTPAANLKAYGSVTLNSRSFTSDDYPRFTFSSPVNQFTERTVKLFERSLDSEGKLSFEAELPDKRIIPTMLSAEGIIRVYEKGGSFTKKNFKTIVAPFESMVGVENIFGWRSASIGTEYKIPFVTLNVKGEPQENRRVKVSVYLNKEHWWWHYENRRSQDFRKMESTYLIDQKEYVSSSDALTHLFEVADDGQHYIEVEDIESGHSAGFFFWASRWGSAQNPNAKKNENLLKLTLDRKSYAPGDSAVVTFDAPKGSIALVTLEQSNRIYHTQWAEAANGEISCKLPLTDELLPNGYVAVSLIQPHKNDNDLPIRLFSIIPVKVSDPKTRMKLRVETPVEIRPNSEFEINVTSEETNEVGTYTIAVVDEGLLSLTNFKTPQPWDHYFKKRGHSVATRDNFDEFIGALLPDMDKLIAVGGDGESKKEKMQKRVDKNKTQRFKPVVMFSKVIAIKPGESVKTTFHMPNYVGAVRVMVVGSAKHSYTSEEKTIPVKQPLMMLTTLPRVVRPGDTIAIPVSVFTMDKEIKKVELSIQTKGNLKLLGAKSATLEFTKPSEKDMSFKAAVDDVIGSDTIVIIAQSGKEQTSDTTFLPILSATPFYTDVLDTMISKGDVLALQLDKLGYKGTNTATLQLSRMPDIQLGKRISDLIRYPYGCIEQTTSATLPQIFLERIADLKDYQKRMATDNVNKGIQRLQSFQISKGFSYWPNNRYSNPYVSEWGTLYMGNMLIEAKEAGYHIPPEMLSHWKVYAKSMADSYGSDTYRYKTYAMFLLAYLGEAPMGKMNYLRENSLHKLDPLSVQLLATAYHLAGQQKVATSIIDSATYEFTSPRELTGTYGSGLRDMALTAYLATLRGDRKLSATLIAKVADRFKPNGWYSTQESAVAVLAIATYYKKFDVTGSIVDVYVKVDGKKEKLTLKKPQYRIDMNEHWGKSVEVTTESDNPLFVTLLRESVPIKDMIKTENKGLTLSRTLYSENGAQISLEDIKQSKPFWIVYSVRSQWSTRLDEIALSSMLPSGWEIINLRLTGEKYPSWLGTISQGEYMDIRDDRINWFFDIYSYNSMKFAVKINPSFVGSYTLPAVTCEAMYSPDYYARLKSTKCSVKK